MALAENNHHTAPRRQTMARAGGGARDAQYGRVPEDALPQAAGARYFAMDAGEDVGEAPAAERPAPLLEVRPQERVQQRTVEQIVDPVLLVPLLHDVVPQMVEQLVDILSPLDFHVAEQVIEVPKIECPPRAARTVLRAPQTVEQLVEVPTPVSYSSLFQRTVEQNVDNPVAGGSGTGGGLSGFLSGQNSAALWNRSVDIPSGRDLQGFQRGQSSTAFMEQITVSPNPGRGLQNFPPVQSSAASSSVSPGHAGQGVFRTFPRDKKSPKVARQVDENLLPDVSSSTPAAYGRHHSWVMVLPADAQFYFWNRHTGTTSWRMPDGWQPCWLLHADGSYVHLQSQVVYESIDEF